MATMTLSTLIEMLSRVHAREGDLPVEVICSREGIAGPPLVAVIDGPVCLDMEYFSDLSAHELEARP